VRSCNRRYKKIKRGAIVPRARLVPVEQIPDAVPLEYLFTSRDRCGWPVTVDIRSTPEGFIGAAPAYEPHQVIFQLGYASVFQRADGKDQRADLKPGDISILPSGLESYWEGTPGSSMGIYLAPHHLDDAYSQAAGVPRSNIALPNLLYREDATLARICELLRLEMFRPDDAGQLLLVEALSTALTLHLVRSYIRQGKGEAAVRPLNPRPLRAVLEFIRDNHGLGMTLDGLADTAGVSRFHFVRLFRKSVGSSPMQYVEGVRLERARAMIREGGKTLSEIAVSMGFSDQSHFTRRFRLRYGCTPAVFADSHGPNAGRRPK
jgi:AraC family transcriptional regulator